MKYVKVIWHIDDEYEPIAFYYEIGKNQIASRAIELFRDNSLRQVIGEALNTPIPTIDEINAIEEFSAFAIERPEFEDIWTRLVESKRD